MTVCPKCDARFPGRTIGSHIKRCPKGVTSLDLFWLKVDKGPHPKGCWLWTGAVEGRGYGHFRAGNKDHRAHHVSWECANGPRLGLHVLHRCDVRNCVNPKHLFLGTHLENMADMKAKGRHTHGETNAHAKLTEAQVLELRARPPRLGRGFREINERAAKYGVSKGAIYCAMTGRTWRYVK